MADRFIDPCPQMNWGSLPKIHLPRTVEEFRHQYTSDQLRSHTGFLLLKECVFLNDIPRGVLFAQHIVHSGLGGQQLMTPITDEDGSFDDETLIDIVIRLNRTDIQVLIRTLCPNEYTAMIADYNARRTMWRVDPIDVMDEYLRITGIGAEDN